MMKFCERFHLTPFEYYALPAGLVDLWNKFTVLEEQNLNPENQEVAE